MSTLYEAFVNLSHDFKALDQHPAIIIVTPFKISELKKTSIHPINFVIFIV